VRDALAKKSLCCIGCIQVQGIVVATDVGEADDIVLGDRASAFGACADGWQRCQIRSFGLLIVLGDRAFGLCVYLSFPDHTFRSPPSEGAARYLILTA